MSKKSELAFIPDDEIVLLIDTYLDGSLSPEQKAALEKRLETEPEVQSYFVEKLHFHAELLESQQPIRVEMSQRRDIIFEVDGGIPKVTKKEVQVARVGNPRTEKFVDLVTAQAQPRWIKWVVLGIFLVALGLIANVVIGPGPAPVPPKVLEIRNPSFEANDLSDDEDGYTYSIFDWQDHFITSRVGLVRLSKYRPGQVAADGENAAYLLRGSYLTQRLLYSDKSELVAEKGLKLRLSGKVRCLDQGGEATLSCALRVVKGIHPEMLQYEPALAEVEVNSVEWQDFEVILQLPEDSLEFEPSDGQPALRRKAGVLDVSGKGMTLSLDHRGQGGMLLDSVQIEVID